MFNEAFFIPVICALLGGTPEQKLTFELPLSGPLQVSETRHVRADCTTGTHVIEVGLADKRSSRDSLQQALFYSIVDPEGRKPMVVLIDGSPGPDTVEMQLVLVARHVGVELRSYKKNRLIRRVMSAYFRQVRDETLNGEARIEAALTD